MELPKGWEKLAIQMPGSLTFKKFNGLVVMITDANYENNMWRHVSMSHRNKLPSYKEMKEVKNIFIGLDKKAIQVFPEENDHVNIHKYCLHLFSPIDHDPLPDFTMGSGMI